MSPLLPLSACVSGDGVAAMVTAVAIDRDRNSKHAVRWAVEKLLKPKDCIILVHVKNQTLLPKIENPKQPSLTPEHEMQQFFLPYRGLCGRKGVRTREIVLHDIDITNALVNFIHEYSISNMVLGASSRSALIRAFRNPDVPSNLSKVVPGFCSLHVVSKAKSQNLRPASQPGTPTRSKIQSRPRPSFDATQSEENYSRLSGGSASSENSSRVSCYRNSGYMLPVPHDMFNRSVVSSPQHSIVSASSSPWCSPNRRFHMKVNPSNQDYADTSDFSGPPSFQSADFSGKTLTRTSDVSRGSASSISSDLESKMRILRLELDKTMDLYRSASKEASTAMEKAKEITKWKTEEAFKIQSAKEAHVAALALAEVEKQKTKAAEEAAQMAQQLAELEVRKRKDAEMKVLHESEEKKKALDALTLSEVPYRKYNIEDIVTATDNFSDSKKIYEGRYGPVYKSFLDHTDVAILILRPDIFKGKKQFEREVHVLSSLRHPYMVLLLGACPELCCLVYEYMENGSLEGRIFRMNNVPSMTWQTRFRIAAEIATSLLFLHQTKPEPLVHRDLKPANILLDRNYVSKLLDVGLSSLIPASVDDSGIQNHLTAAAGTFCYIDPEYQQTGIFSVKSDIYSFGILLLQLITAKPAKGLTLYVERAIVKGTVVEILDPTVSDWPVEKALRFVNLALKCCEMSRKDRPDLATVILPELKRLGSFDLDDGAETGSPSFEETRYHRRPPFPEGPKRKNSLSIQTETR